MNCASGMFFDPCFSWCIGLQLLFKSVAEFGLGEEIYVKVLFQVEHGDPDHIGHVHLGLLAFIVQERFPFFCQRGRIGLNLLQLLKTAN